MSQFDKLMSELGSIQADQETMTKALPADDGKDEKKIQAAAEDGGLGDGGADDAGGKSDVDADDKDGAPMAKSFKMTLEDGTEVEAMDGTELVKALSARVEVMEQNEGQMTKALESAVALIGGQRDLIKSLAARVEKLSGEGRGRKAVVSISEKADTTAAATSQMAKSLTPDGMTPETFFAKALDAQKAGRITATDISVAETYLNKGQAIPASLVSRVMA
mgnify:CR=1 FL=1